MTIADLLDALHARDVRLQVRAGRLVVDAPTDALDDTLRAALRDNRDELVSLLGRGATAVRPLRRGPRGERTPFPLSISQHAFYLLDRMTQGGRAFNIFALRDIRGDLDVTRLQAALTTVVAAHDVLRTTFEFVGDEPRQIVHASVEIPFELVDVSGPGTEAAAAAARACDRCEAPRFDIERGPLFHVRLVRQASDRHTLVLALHHIIADDRTVDLFLRELVRAYLGEAAPYSATAPQYPDFAQWEHDRLASGALDATINYWLRQLADAPVLLSPGASTGVVGEARCATMHRRLDAQSAGRVRAAAARSEASTFTLLLSAYQLLWALYSGSGDVPIVVPVTNRSLPETQDMFGMFVNAVVMRTDVDAYARVDELVRANAEISRAALDHCAVSLEALDGILRRRGQRGLDALSRIGFNHFAAVADARAQQIDGLAIAQRPVDRIESVFDVLLIAQERDDGLQLKLEYRDDLWTADAAQRFLEQYVCVLDSLCERADGALAGIALADGAGVAAAVNAAAVRDWPDPAASILDLVAAQALRSAALPAIDDGVVSLTYAQLTAASEAYAAWIAAHAGAIPSVIGVCVARDAALPALLLGVWRAGCAFVPLDPASPPERLAIMLRDAAVRCIVASGDVVQRLQDCPVPVHRVPPLQTDGKVLPPTVAIAPQDLAYVMFTSGSSGVPSGVRVPHAALSNVLQSFRESTAIASGDTLLAATNLTFDIALLELLLPLVAGARVCIARHSAATDPAHVLDLLDRPDTTLAQATPSTWRLLLRCGWQGHARLRVLCGGEALDAQLAAALLDRSAVVWNVYGPTETTIWSTLARVTSAAQARSIGRPIANTSIRVVDARGRPVPVGVAGELWIGGAGVALGYCDGARAARFVETFGEGATARWYRTGDTVVLDANGNLAFVGRTDRQIKRRGVRIELDEIEASLHAIDGIVESAVWFEPADEGGALIAAVATASHDADSIRRRLQARLPPSLLPDRIDVHRELPRLASGKLDRRRIAADAPSPPSPSSPSSPSSPLPSGDDLEAAITRIWAEALGHTNFAGTDNFFDVGGHSMLLVGVHRQIEAAIGIEFAPIELFNHPNITALARFLRSRVPLTVATGDVAPASLAPAAAPIAIIGLAVRVPGAADITQFWVNLCAGRESIRDLDAATLTAQGVPPALQRDPRYVPRASTLDDIEHFDADFFGLSAREAELLDPQHRLLLELCYQALEDAGYARSDTTPRVGLYAGVGLSAYLIYNLWPNRAQILATQSPLELLYANDKDYAVMRTAYALNLRGPAVSIGTACSTGLVAVHEACRSLRDGECEIALAAAAKISVPHETGYLYADGGIVSPDGHCRPFDAAAAGTVFGSGGACVVLKPLAAAERDGDAIYAIVAGSAVNNDGRGKLGFTAPSTAGQAQVVSAALERAGISPRDVGYVEAHGTGTLLGDPVEAAALQQVFAHGTVPAAPCLVGSVKSNIGHLDTAAGIVGLVKATLSLYHGCIPASLHHDRLNARIDWDPRRFRIATALQPWTTARGARVAGVSSFGIGGTNAHVVLRDHGQARHGGHAPPETAPQLVVLSAASERALHDRATALALTLDAAAVPLVDIAHTLQAGRPPLRWRAALVANSVDDLRVQLRTAHLVMSPASAGGQRRVVFLCPGQGGSRAGAPSALYDTWPAFRDAYDTCVAAVVRLSGVDLSKPPADAADARCLSRMEPARFALQYGYAQLLVSAGVRPSALLGHGSGEIVAACLAGVLDLDDALRLVVTRAAAMQAVADGAMLAVSAPADAIATWLPADVDIAAFDGVQTTVVSGSPAAIHSVRTACAAAGIRSHFRCADRAFHSRHMTRAAEAVTEALHVIRPRAPALPLLSTLRGDWESDAFADAGYWGRQMCGPVRFVQCLDALRLTSDDVVVELDPGPGSDPDESLTRLVSHHYPSLADVAAPSCLGGGDAVAQFLAVIGHAWRRGIDVDAAISLRGKGGRRVHLPAYTFDRQRYWIDRHAPSPVDSPGGAPGPVREDAARWLYQPAWVARRVPAPQAADVRDGSWIVLVSDAETPLERALVERLVALGAAPLVLKKTPATAASLAAMTLVVGSADPDPVAVIAAGLRQAARGVCRVVFGWSLDTPRATPDLAVALAVLARAGAAFAGTAPDTGRLLALTRETDTTAPAIESAANAAIGGAIRVLRHEHPGLQCRQLVVDDIAMVAIRDTADRVIAELTSATDEVEVAIRRGQRQVATYCRYQAVETSCVSRPDGVCVITGGLGGIGALLTDRLVDGFGTIVLFGRSSLDDATPARGHGSRQAQLRARAATVHYRCVDVADARAFAHAIAAVESEFGAIALVVHAAGVADGRLAELHDAASIATVLAPKVEAALVLFDGAARGTIGRVVLCSSLTATTGDIGQYAYAAANAALDAIAQAASARGFAWTSIAWDTWRETGMAARSAAGGVASEVLAQRRARGLDDAEGVALFERLLGDPAERVIVSTTDLDARLRVAAGTARGAGLAARGRYPRPALPHVPAAPMGEIERRVQQLWCDALQLAEVGVTDSYFDLGGTSLEAVRLAETIGAALGVRMGPGALLEHPTVRELAAWLDDRGSIRRDSDSERLLVPLTPPGLDEDHAPSLCLVHPIGGQVYVYRELATALAGDLQTHGLRASAEASEATVGELAAAYLDHLRRHSPAPRVLGGASFGGMIAYEMACRLAAAGDPPDLLVMLDTPDAADVAGRYDDDVPLLRYLAEQMPEFAWLRTPVAESQPAALRAFVEHARDSELVRHLRRLRGHMRAMQQYVAPAYPHPVLYVKAGQRRAGVDPAAPESAWRARAARFSFAVVDGDHVSMHQTPHVTAVAAHIRDAFAALSRRAARIGSGEIRHV